MDSRRSKNYQSYREPYQSSQNSWSGLADTYDPIKIGSIDGTDSLPHDKAIIRAVNSKYKPNPKVSGIAEHTIFVGKLHPDTKQNTIEEKFKSFGSVVSCRLIRDIVTGQSKGYAFVEYSNSRAARHAYRQMNMEYIDNARILVDFEMERQLKGWVPRRLGGGFGGKKESGQLRFGCRTRPFQMPIAIERTKFPNKRKYEESQ